MRTADRGESAEASAPQTDALGGARWSRHFVSVVRVAEVLSLPAIVLAATVLAARYSLRVDEWRVMTDEMLYLRIAQNIGETLSPLPEVHGVHLQVYSLLYPVLLAPLVGAFDLPTAAHVAHALNALLMASAAIPAYLLTRWLVPSRLAAPAVAALTVFVPWLALSLSLMTEVVAYPVLIWAVYAMTRSIATPSPKADAVALAGLVGAFLARTQFLFLFAVLPVATIAHELGYRLVESARGGRRAALRQGIVSTFSRHILLWGAVALGLVVLVAGVNVYGSYRGVLDQQDPFAAGTATALLEHVNHIAVGIAVVPIPLTLAFVASSIARPSGDRRAHAFAVVLLLVLPAICLIAATFDQTLVGKPLQERYLFYIVPFLFAGTAACLLRRRPPVALMLGAALLTALGVLQTEYLLSFPFPIYASPAKLVYGVLDFRAGQVGDLLGIADLGAAPLLALVSVATVAVVAAAARAGHGTAAFAILTCGLVAWGLAVYQYSVPRVLGEHEAFAEGSLGPDRPDRARTWIDRAVPAGARVGLVPSPINSRGARPFQDAVVDQAVWWDPEFWNKSVDRTYQLLGTQTYTPFPVLGMKIDSRTGVLRPSSGRMRDRLLLARSDVRFAPRSTSPPVLSGDLALYAAARPPRAAWTLGGTTALGYFDSTRGAKLTIFASRRATEHRVRLLLDRGDGRLGRYAIEGSGVHEAGRLSAPHAVAFKACVPAGRPWAARVDLPGSQRARVAEVLDTAGAACRGDSANARAGG